MHTELENLHGRFLLNLSFMQQCPVESIVNSMAGMERIKDGYALLPNIKSGGETFQPPQPISFTDLLLLYQHASLSAYKPQRKVIFGTQLYKPMAFTLLFLFPEKGGRELVTTIDTCLVCFGHMSSPLTVASEGGC